MSHLAETILSAAQALPEGGLLSAKEFLHLASRAAVDQTLTRLTREGKLMRVVRGAYAAPVISRFGARPLDRSRGQGHRVGQRRGDCCQRS